MTALLVKLLFLLFLFFSSVTDANASVVINEFQIEPDGASQWAELYNNGGENVDISGWFIDDSGGSEKFTIPSGTVLGPNACVSFASGKFNWNTSSSDSARLLSGDSVVDSYSYSGSTVPNISFARLPDGIGGWTTSATPSRDKLNANGVLCYIPPTPTPTPTATPIPTNTPEPTSTSIPTPTKVSTPTPTQTPTQSKLPTPTKRTTTTVALATMAGEVLSTAAAGATVSPAVLPSTARNLRPLIIGLLLTGLGLALLSLAFVLKKLKERKEDPGL